MGDRTPKYNRILLKLSGEALGGKRDYGIDLEVVQTIAGQVKRVHEMGVQIALVVGGGNIFRGLAASERGFDRATGDYMGMLATVINALALQDALERTGIPARTMTAIQMPQVAEPYIRRRAVRHLEKGRVVILAAGTGNPYFTTDTTAALRAVEIEADVILKATKVDGVYTADPKLDPKAVKFEHLSAELTGIRTGRANPALIDKVMVPYYGTPTPLNQLAQISAPEPRLLIVQVYDKSQIGAIEKALRTGEQGLNPASDGQVIRVPIPPLTEERRKEYVKLVRHKAEEARVAIRNVRRDEIHRVDAMQKAGDVPEDEAKRGTARLQKITESQIERVDALAARKENEVMEV